eukprot:7378090-Prymnesium_polylepis.2
MAVAQRVGARGALLYRLRARRRVLRLEHPAPLLGDARALLAPRGRLRQPHALDGPRARRRLRRVLQPVAKRADA